VRLLITGGRGFIGRHVATEATRRGHLVQLLAHDLREPQGLAKHVRSVDAVVHCAAAMSGDLESQRAVNVDGTRNLLAAMSETGITHIVALSTLALYDYDGIPVGSPLDEESPLATDLASLGSYVITKRRQEELIREHAASNGWQWTILRPGIVFGRDRLWFHHLGLRLSPVWWVCYGGDSLLPLTYVENCAEAIVLALEQKAANGAVLNLTDDDLPDRRRYVRELCRRLEMCPRAVHLPWGVLDAAARSTSWANRVLLRGRAHVPDVLQAARLSARCKPLQYRNARAKTVLGWSPRWTFEQSLDRTLKPAISRRPAEPEPPS